MSRHTEWCRGKMENTDGCVCVDGSGGAVTYTPGPWRSVESGTVNLPAFDIEASKKTGGWRLITCLASSTHTSAEYDEQMKANAHLIAAAPELLEALEALVDLDGHAYAACNSTACVCGQEEKYEEVSRRARAAVLKAKGGP